MTPQQAIKIMFPDNTSEVWQDVFFPEMSAVAGKVWLHPIKLDDWLMKEYGKYEESLADFIKKKWGQEVLDAVNPNN